MLRAFHGLALAAALALGACAAGSGIGGGRIDFVRVETAYSRADFAYAGAGRDLTTEILGNPFVGVAQAAFDQSVTDAMQGAHFGPRTHFTTAPDETARPVYRVRMLWNGPPGTNGGALCDGTPLAGGGPASGEVRLIAAFCRSDRPATYLSGSVDGVTGPDDPRFIGFIRQVTSQLFPPRDGIFESDSCMWATC